MWSTWCGHGFGGPQLCFQPAGHPCSLTPTLIAYESQSCLESETSWMGYDFPTCPPRCLPCGWALPLSWFSCVWMGLLGCHLNPRWQFPRHQIWMLLSRFNVLSRNAGSESNWSWPHSLILDDRRPPSIYGKENPVFYLTKLLGRLGSQGMALFLSLPIARWSLWIAWWWRMSDETEIRSDAEVRWYLSFDLPA